MGESILLNQSLSLSTSSLLPSLSLSPRSSIVIRSSLAGFPRFILSHPNRLSTWTGKPRVVSEPATPTLVFEPEIGGGGGGLSGGGGGGGGGRGEGEGEEGESSERKKKGGMSMSQKFTLAYAALVGVGGVMGYMKTGSTKSLIAGGVSAAVLGYVYTALPTNPTLASAIGLGISAALLGVMGSRFKKSGKVFPAGVVSAMSLVMTAGYLHGIMRTSSH